MCMLVCKQAPTHRKQGETKERSAPLQIDRCGVPKQGDLHRSLPWVYREFLPGYCHIFSSDDLSNTLLSQACVLENNSSHCGNGAQNIHFEDRGGSEEPPTAWMNFVGSTGNHIPSITPFNSVQWFTVMLVIAKHWKQPECPTLVTGLIWYIYAIK